MKKHFQIIFEDDDVVICNKSAGVLSIPDRYDKEKANLFDVLKQKRTQLFIVHRLDKMTSGLICYAKNAKTHKHLNLQFEKRSISKHYSCIVQGKVPSASGRIESKICPDPNKPGKMMVYTKGKTAISHFEIIEQFAQYAWLSIRIETGRSHQIRVQLSHLGNPIIGDTMYGGDASFLLSSIKGRKYRLGKNAEERPLLSRVALHSKLLRFQNLKGDTCEFTCEEPKDMRAVINQLRKFNKNQNVTFK